MGIINQQRTPIQGQTPNSIQTYPPPGRQTVRVFGPDSRAVRDIDYGSHAHSGYDPEPVERVIHRWPTFHDSELLALALDRIGPSISLRVLIADPDAPGRQHYEMTLRFDDIENLVVRDFGYHNVIDSLQLLAVKEERFTSERLEERMRVVIASVFRANCEFSTPFK